MPRTAYHAPDSDNDSTPLAPAPGAAAARTPGWRERFTTGTQPGSGLPAATGPRPRAQRWGHRGRGSPGAGVGGGGARPREPVRRGSRGQRPLPPRPRAPLRTLPPGLTFTSRAAPAGRAPAPGAPLRPNPASVPLSLTLLAGGSGRGGSAAARGRLLAPGELGARRRQPAPAARPAPAAPGPPPPVTKAGPRPDTGRAQEERARLRVAGVNVPDVGRVGAASAPSAAGTPRPFPRGRSPGAAECASTASSGGRARLPDAD